MDIDRKLVLTGIVGGKKQTFLLGQEPLSLGSSPQSDLVITDPSISRNHAVLTVDGSSLKVRDLSSTNGLFVNGVRTREGIISVGQALSVGRVLLRLEEERADDLEVALPMGSATNPSEESQLALTTLGVPSFDPLFLEDMPQLARLALEETPLSLAGSVGAAWMDRLRLAKVEIYGPGETSPLWFTAGESSAEATLSAESPGGIRFRGWALVPELAQTLKPLAEFAVYFLELAQGRRLKGRLKSEARVSAPPSVPSPPSVDPIVQKIYTDAIRVAAGTVSVIILGESGTGKEVLARFLHRASPRRDAPFVALNCAALPRDLLEAELFGVEKGAATGVEARPGKFEQAHGGTIFLDEVGDMALETQAKLLRVLQEKIVYRVGGTSSRQAEVRVLAATNVDLKRRVEEGEFRSDLYHRLAGWGVVLPPLRQRAADIPNLALWFLDRELSQQGINLRGISRGALTQLQLYHWPGNIRELEQEMARAALFLDQGEILTTRHLRPEVATTTGAPEGQTLKERLARHEGEIISGALADCGNQVDEAAAALGIHRATLYRRMKALGLTDEDH